MPSLGRLHDLGELAHHVLGMEEEDRRPVRTDARGSEHALPQPLEVRAGGLDLGYLETHMVLPPERVLGEEGVERAVRSPSGSISSICVPFAPVEVGVSTKQTFTPCSGKSNGSVTAVAPIVSR